MISEQIKEKTRYTDDFSSQEKNQYWTNYILINKTCPFKNFIKRLTLSSIVILKQITVPNVMSIFLTNEWEEKLIISVHQRTKNISAVLDKLRANIRIQTEWVFYWQICQQAKHPSFRNVSIFIWFFVIFDWTIN